MRTTNLPLAKGRGPPSPRPEWWSGAKPGVTATRRFRPFLRGLLALAALLAGASAFARSAVIASTNPSPLNQANLPTAWIAVNLTSATYTAAAAPSHFTLTTTIPGLSVNSLSFNSGRNGATVYLHWDGSDSLAAGETAGGEALAWATALGGTLVTPTAGGMPRTTCNGAPCWNGLQLAAGPPLVLFWAPPTARPAPTPAPLFGDELRLLLRSLIDVGGPAVRWQASSSDPSVATARIRAGELLVEPASGAEGVVEIEVEAADEHGQSATVRFEVRVEFHWPPRRCRLVRRARRIAAERGRSRVLAAQARWRLSSQMGPTCARGRYA